MDVQVLNKRNLSDPLPGVNRVYVGRPSILGNPFEIGKDGSRADVIAKYRTHLWNQIKNSEPVRNELSKLLNMAKSGGVQLVCWCSPQDCHADVIKSCLNWMNSKAM